jgi:tRNA/rRNA methyltransferase
MGLHHCRVVLVETLYPGNLGATARVMRNFGLRDLVLVSPAANLHDPKARQMSTHGENILEAARVVPDFGMAVADCVIVAGTSARSGGLFRKQTVGAPHAVLPYLVEMLRADHPTALVFGTESSGLTNDIITRCHHLIQIPAHPEYPSLNLAQAVAICLYELNKAWQAREPCSPMPDEPATFDALEHLYSRLSDALERIHFLYGDKAGALMHGIRHLLGKARLSNMEVKLLLGLARQIRWYADQPLNSPKCNP